MVAYACSIRPSDGSSALHSAELRSAAAELRDVVDAEHAYPAERFAGRGIVMCAGGARLLTCAWVAINVLRRVLGCRLPIELWHLGPAELGPLEAALFGELGVDVVDALEPSSGASLPIRGGWELKAHAIVNSRFEQVLGLDADNVAVSDPASLFDSAQFGASGAIFWPDIERLRSENVIWELCGVPFRSEPSWETGQLVIDKSRCWRALQIALHMNMRSDVFYRYIHGDKDTFHLAWILADQPVSLPPFPARWTVTGIYQRDFDGRLLFQHRTDGKWRLSGPNLHSADFRHESECLRFLEELRERWSGRIDALPPRAPRDAELERELVATVWFRLAHEGRGTHLIELLSDNRVGIGADRGERLRWYVRDGLLTLDGRDRRLPPLGRSAEGEWASAQGGVDVRLIAAPHAGRGAIGLAAEAVLARVAEPPSIAPDDAVTTLATLGRVGSLRDALARAQSRWRGHDGVQRVIELARRRIGTLDPSIAPPDTGGYEPLPEP